jgi:hypothetical protein
VDSSASTPKSASRPALEHNASSSCVDICRPYRGGASMVEPLSPMALPRRASGGVFGPTAVSPKQPNARLTPQKDRLGTIDLH